MSAHSSLTTRKKRKGTHANELKRKVFIHDISRGPSNSESLRASVKHGFFHGEFLKVDVIRGGIFQLTFFGDG